MQLIQQVWDPVARRYVEDKLTLWDALPSWQREALETLAEAFPGAEWVVASDDDQMGSEATQAVA